LYIFNILNYWFFNFNYLGFIYNFLLELLDWNYLGNMNFFNYHNCYLLWNSHNLLLNNWDLHFAINYFLYLFDLLYNYVSDFLDFLYLNNWHQLFFDHLNFFDNSLDWSQRHWLFDNFDNFNEGLNNSLYWDYLLNINGNFLDNFFNGNLTFRNNLILNNFDYFLFN